MDELDYRTYTLEQAVEHLPSIIYDIISNNTEYHPREALEKYAVDWAIDADNELRFYFPLKEGGAIEVSFGKLDIKRLSEEEY